MLNTFVYRLTVIAPLVIAAAWSFPVFASSDSEKEPDFTPLFNGENLDGWIGDKGSYTVKDGAIMCKKGSRGDLMTRGRYSDFVLRFDFKLTPGANNGLGIRQTSSSNGDNFHGMELQIIDSTAKKYDNLKPYQYHGSLYHYAPAERGHLKPVGQWNHQQVTLDGRRVKVVLNGATILDVNIDEAASGKNKSRNVDIKSGHLGFLGHGDQVFFRNVRIRKLDDEPAFKPLFNGENLDGWMGDKKGYAVEDGAILCRGGRGGDLLTKKKYEDFVLHFDFKLTPGANNGLGIRQPGGRGRPAMVGMELQILDNSASKWKNLKDWQYHGSLYGLAPAKRGHLKPVGQWNHQEVTLHGRQVKVVLNGATILDVNIDQVIKNGPIDGRDHPGARNRTGHIGFLGHGDRVFFRNIRIKELE